MTETLLFLIGTMFGAVLGFFACALLSIGRDAERDSEIMALKWQLEEKERLE